jgi:hypothetical protein
MPAAPHVQLLLSSLCPCLVDGCVVWALFLSFRQLPILVPFLCLWLSHPVLSPPPAGERHSKAARFSLPGHGRGAGPTTTQGTYQSCNSRACASVRAYGCDVLQPLLFLYNSCLTHGHRLAVLLALRPGPTAPCPLTPINPLPPHPLTAPHPPTRPPILVTGPSFSSSPRSTR